jgi:hypothetical protein
MDSGLLYSKTPLSSFTKGELRKIASVCQEYCVKKLGVKRRKKPISFSIVKNVYRDSYSGDYCPDKNLIRIFHNEISTLGHFTSTFIHEYTHSLQPISTKYHKLLDKYGYDAHPHEIEARRNECLYNKKILVYLRKSKLVK